MRRMFLGATVAVALIAAGCGDDDDSDSSSTEGGGGSVETTTGASTGSSGDFVVDEPVKIIGFWEVKGESAPAVDDFQNATEIAIEDINAAGGVGGKPVEFVRVPGPVTDPQAAVTQYVKAIAEKPAIIVGAGGSTEALSAQIARGGIPLISPDVNANVEFGAPGGSEWLWLISSDQRQSWSNATRYVVEELGATELGTMGYAIPFGSIGRETVAEVAPELGAEVTVDREIPVLGQDLTQAVLAMKDVDAVFNASYNNDNALQLNQFAQNGYEMPTMLQGGVMQVVGEGSGLVSGPILDTVYAWTDCNPLSDDPGMQRFAETYEERFGAPPTYLAAITYDMVQLAAEAIRQAKSVEPQAVNDAIASITYTDGICMPDYHADGAHVLVHTNTIIHFNQGGTWDEVKSYTNEDLPKVGS